MSNTYSGNPASSRKDAVRALVGDVGPAFGKADWLLTDQEISYFDSVVKPSFDDALMTAAVCADIIGGRMALELNISADGVSISGGDLQQKYNALAASLRQTYKTIIGAGGAPVAGGIDRFQVPDLTLKPLSFAVGMDDNYRAGGQQLPVDGDYGDYGYGYGWPESEPW